MFQAGINEGADMVMVSHMAAPTLTGDNEPSIFSRVILKLSQIAEISGQASDDGL